MKRTLALLLTLIMVFAATAFSVAADAPPFEVDSDEFPGIPGFRRYDPEITLTYARSAGLDFNFAPGQSYEENIWTTEFKEILGINIDTIWTAEGVEAYDTKLGLVISTRDLPDVFVCNAAQFTSLMKGGLIEDLTDVLEEYQSDLIRENLAADGGLALSHSTRDGRIYGLPQQSAGPGEHEFIYIREDWRVALGLPEPKTMDDVWALAEAFTGNNLDGTGLRTYGLGLSNQPWETYWAIKGFSNAFGAYPDQWILKDGAVVNGYVQPEMRGALVELKKYIDAGFVDPEWVTTDSYTASQKALAGESGIAFGQWWVLGWPLDSSMRLGYQWKAYAIPTSDRSEPQRVGTVLKQGPRWVVRKGYEHPEALVKMYNLFHERVMSQRYDTMIYKGDGTYDFEGLTPVYTVIGHDRNAFNHTVVLAAVEAQDESLLTPGNSDQEMLYERAMHWLNQTGGLEDPAAEGYWDRYNEYYQAYWGHVAPGSVYGILVDDYTKNDLSKLNLFTDAPTEAMVKYNEGLKSFVTEAFVNFLSGADSLESDWDRFVSTWESMGGAEITTEVNAWYADQF